MCYAAPLRLLKELCYNGSESRRGGEILLLLGEQPMTTNEAQLCSPLRLAYIGDTIWDLLVRSRLMFLGYNLHHMHEEAVRSVNAQAQAAGFHRIEEILTDEETAVARRGRNAHARHPAPKNQTPEDSYRTGRSHQGSIFQNT